jgi:hypothetical protein
MDSGSDPRVPAEAVSPRAGYDKAIAEPKDRDDIGVVVDPLVYRNRPAVSRGWDCRWERSMGRDFDDLGALMSFFDLVVMHDKLPAFTCSDAFDMHLSFGEGGGCFHTLGGWL